MIPLTQAQTKINYQETIVPEADILNDQEERHETYRHPLSTTPADLRRFCQAEGVSQATLASGVYYRLLSVLTDKKDVMKHFADSEQMSVRDFLHAIHTRNDGSAYPPSGNDNVPLSLQPAAQDDKLILDVQYLSNKYSKAYIRRMAESYDALMQHMIAAPDTPVHHTSIMSDRQRAEVASMHQTTMADAPTTTFHEGVLRWAKDTPDTVALIAADRTLTYAELNTAVERLAAELQSRGLTKGDRVVLLLPRRSCFIVSMLAVMQNEPMNQ